MPITVHYLSSLLNRSRFHVCLPVFYTLAPRILRRLGAPQLQTTKSSSFAMPPALTLAPTRRLVMDQSWPPDNSYLTTNTAPAVVAAATTATTTNVKSMTPAPILSHNSSNNATTLFPATLVSSSSSSSSFSAPSSSSSSSVNEAFDTVSDATAQLFLVLLLTTFIVISVVVLRTVTHTSALPSSSSSTRHLQHAATATLNPSVWFLASTVTHESDALMLTTTTSPASTSLFYGATPASPSTQRTRTNGRSSRGDENNDDDSDTGLYYYNHYHHHGRGRRGDGSGSSNGNGVVVGITDAAMEEATYEALLQLEDVLGTVKTGLSDEQIDILPCYTYMQHDEKKDDDDDDDENQMMMKKSEHHTGKETRLCAICRDDVRHLDRMRMLPCGDDFHAHCIARWLKIHPSCPLCRTRFA